MVRPARAADLPGLGAVGTPRKARGTMTMETTMTKKIRRSDSSSTASTMKTKTGPDTGKRQRRRQQTKKQICVALLERPKGASIAEMQKAMGWQAHSVRGFLAGAVKKLPGLTLTSEKPGKGQRRYRLLPSGV